MSVKDGAKIVKTFLKKIKRHVLAWLHIPKNIRSLADAQLQINGALKDLDEKIARLHEMSGHLLDNTSKQNQTPGITEFKIYSQWGEDGIIASLIDMHDIADKCFIEFGVETYLEANTRWLLIKRRWRGLVIDGSARNVSAILRSDLTWRYGLRAVSAMVTAENIDEIFAENGFKGEVGLLSIDIDGMDYWVWKSIRSISPVIVVIEYNSLFGPDRSVTVPYDPTFERKKAHGSCLYYGASLSALVKLGREKGYSFVGTNAAGNNAFFVRDDKKNPALESLTAEKGFASRCFREYRDENWTLANSE